MLTVPVEQPVDPVRSSLYCLFTGAVLLLVQLGRPDLQNGFCEGSSHHLGKPDSMQVGTPLDQVRTGPAVSHGKPLVVLLHGLMRGRKSMEKLRRWSGIAAASCLGFLNNQNCCTCAGKFNKILVGQL